MGTPMKPCRIKSIVMNTRMSFSPLAWAASLMISMATLPPEMGPVAVRTKFMPISGLPIRITAAEAAHMVVSAISTVRYCASMARPSIIVPMCTISTGMNVIARLISPVVLNKSAGIPSQKAARIMAEETKRMETSARVREAIRSPTVKKPRTTRID